MPATPHLPTVDLLLGQHTTQMFAAALAGQRCTLDGLRPLGIRIDPAGDAVVRYAAGLRHPDGTRTQETLVAATGRYLPPGATVLQGQVRDQQVDVGVWRWPQDPALPALGTVLNPATLRDLLTGHGLRAGRELTVMVHAYRPGQRAVLAASDGSTRWFVKVVRPDAVTELARRHRLCGDAVSVPAVLATTDDGAVVLAEAAGTPLRALLADPTGTQRAPTPTHLEAVLDALPDSLLSLPSARPLSHRVGQAASVLCHITRGEPQLGHAVSDIAETLIATEWQNHPSVPIHGDFYEAQLLATDGRLTGLLDLDTAGPGIRADDWATLIGHLSVAGLTRPAPARYAERLLAHAVRRCDPADLHARIAVVVFGLAGGPFRSCQPNWAEPTAQRLALARHFARTGQRQTTRSTVTTDRALDERALTAASRTPHRDPAT